MKNKFNRFLILCLAGLLTLASCQNSGNLSSDTTDGVTDYQTEAATTPREETAAESELSSEDVTEVTTEEVTEEVTEAVTEEVTEPETDEPDIPTPCRVFPYPLVKCSLDLLLLTLCDCSFFLVEDLLFVSVLVNRVIKDTHVLEVQALLDDLITVDSMSTVSCCRLDVSSVSCLIGYDPL